MAITKAKKNRIWEASDHRCRYCHKTLKYEEATLDHIKPASSFSSNKEADAEDNLCICCRACNTAKADLSVTGFRKFVNTRNNELLALEARRRKAIAESEQLSQQIEGKRFRYIHYLREHIQASICHEIH